jgi:hypothetical protein
LLGGSLDTPPRVATTVLVGNLLTLNMPAPLRCADYPATAPRCGIVPMPLPAPSRRRRPLEIAAHARSPVERSIRSTLVTFIPLFDAPFAYADARHSMDSFRRWEAQSRRYRLIRVW